MARHADTVFERAIRRILHLPWWLLAGLALAFTGMPFAIAAAEGLSLIPATMWDWRNAVFPVVGMAYVIAVTPAMWRAEQAVAEGLKPLVESWPPAAGGAKWRSSQGDWAAFGAGVLGSLLLAASNRPEKLYLVDYYVVLTYSVMYGTLAWLIYAALRSVGLTALLQRTLRPHNPFDLTPFEPVGRQGLVLALVFVGGITLSLFFVYTPSDFFDWPTLVIYTVLILATLSVFFGAMWPAHRTLLRVKREKQAEVQRLVAQSFERLESALRAGDACGPVAAEFQTWLTLAQQLEQTPTWPFDLIMLRTLALSVLTPAFVALFRVIGLWWTEGHF